MLSFSIPRISADRLSRLPLASADETGPLGHVSVRVTPSAVRFACTNGRLLASLVIPLDALTGEPCDSILDADQFIAALKATAKATGGRITVEIGPKEARLTNSTASAIVRCIDGSYPQFDHIWSRTAGRRWVPTMSCLDGSLVAAAQKISGCKNPLWFASPVDPGARLERLWAVPVAQPDESISVSALRAVVTAPAYWSDGVELSILLMPIARSDSERQLDLSVHVVPLPQVTVVAA
jgi:hypothetical protein